MCDFFKGVILVRPILYEKCSVISPYSPNKYSKVNYEYSDRLAAGSSYASPQTEGNPALSTPPLLTLPKGPGRCTVHIKHTIVSAASAITAICMLICVDGLGYKNDMRVSVHGQITAPGEQSEETMPNTPSWFPLICRIRTTNLDSPVVSQNVTAWPHICM